MTPELLKKCMPGITAVDAVKYAAPLSAAMEKFKINTPMRQAMFLAQLAHESHDLRYKEEIASGKAYDTRTDLGNTPEVDGDGERYKGRGPLQITGTDMYRKVGKALGYDFLKNPEALELPGAGSMASAWVWAVEKKLNEIADKPETWRGNTRRYKNLAPFDYCSVIINGGLNGFEDRRKRFVKCKLALGIK